MARFRDIIKSISVMLVSLLAFMGVFFALGCKVSLKDLGVKFSGEGRDLSSVRIPIVYPDKNESEFLEMVSSDQLDETLTFYRALPEGSNVRFDARSPVAAEKDKQISGAQEIKEQPVERAREERSWPSEDLVGATETGRYVVQVASLRASSAAKTIVGDILNSHPLLPVRLKAVDLGADGVWHRVQIGGYESADEARAIRRMIAKDKRYAPIVKVR